MLWLSDVFLPGLGLVPNKERSLITLKQAMNNNTQGKIHYSTKYLARVASLAGCFSGVAQLPTRSIGVARLEKFYPRRTITMGVRIQAKPTYCGAISACTSWVSGRSWGSLRRKLIINNEFIIS